MPARAVGAAGGLLPAPGGTRFIILTLPSDTAMAEPAFDPVAFDREQRAAPRPVTMAFVLIGAEHGDRGPREPRAARGEPVRPWRTPIGEHGTEGARRLG